MPIESQENKVIDYLEQEAIAEGIQQVQDERDQPNEIILKLSDEQDKMLQSLYRALGLSAQSVVTSAIKYLHFQLQTTGVKAEDMENYPQVNVGNKKFKLKITAETAYKLDEMGMTEQINECAILGLKLLYDRLIGYPSNGENQ